MRHLRLWIVRVLLEVIRHVHPAATKPGMTWQIIEVPRRISEGEAQDLAGQVKQL